MIRSCCYPGLLLALSVGQLAPVFAQSYPVKPIRLIVPWPAGGNADLVARTVAQKMGEQIGQQFIIDNRAGAGGNIGMELAAKAPPDGYTLALPISANAINAALYPKLSFDLQRDFAPIGLVAALPLILVVHPSLPVRSVKELIALARTRAGQLNYASGGIGTGGHMAAELFKSMARVDMVHIAYKGATPAVTDLVAGNVQVFFDGVPSALPHVRSGRLKMLAITTAQRSATLPEVPTVAEAGLPGFEVSLWLGLSAPAGTDRMLITRLHDELQKALGTSDVKQRFEKAGLDTLPGPADQLDKVVRADVARWSKVIREAGIKAE